MDPLTGDVTLSSCPVTVYYNAPGTRKQQLRLAQQVSTFKLPAKIAGSPGRVLLDSGATSNFVGANFTSRRGVTVRPLLKQTDVDVADGSSVRAVGTCTFKVQIQDYTGDITAIVLTDLVE